MRTLRVAAPFSLELEATHDLDLVSELIIWLDVKESDKVATWDKLDEFMKRYEDRRISVALTRYDADVARRVIRSYDNAVIRIASSDDIRAAIEDHEGLDGRYYFSREAIAPRCWTDLRWFVGMRVSDVFPIGDLFYDLARVRENAPGIRLRGILNRTFDSPLGGMPTWCRAFVLPQDRDAIEEFDVCEFDCSPVVPNGSDFDPEVFRWLRKRYTEGKFVGDVGEIVRGMGDTGMQASHLPQKYGARKIRCKLKCGGVPGNACDACERIVRMTQMMEEMGSADGEDEVDEGDGRGRGERG